MPQFGSFGDLARALARVDARLGPSLEAGLGDVARAIEDDAKSQIGTYQRAAGPFPAWAPLAESTKRERVRLGFAPDDPLLRTGDLRESISHEVQGLSAVIGSRSVIAKYQEFGTERIPPRPFIGPAAFKKKKAVRTLIGMAVLRAFG